MVRRATKKTQAQKRRREKKLIVVATEGKNKTETNYLKAFNRCQSEYRVVPAKGNNTDAGNIVDDAIKAISQEELRFDFGDLAVALVDTDKGKEAQIKSARGKAQKNNVQMILSNPCFEVWLLQHYRFSTRSYNSSNEAIEELKSHWSEYEKNTNDFSALIKTTKTALEHAKKLRQHHTEASSTNDVLKCNPGTDVDKLVKMLHET